MPQTQANKEYISFVKGIITEASPLTFPENASIDEQNFILNRDGSRQRRLGMELEEDGILTSLSLLEEAFSDLGVSIHLWKNINERADLALYVIQVGDRLYFYDALKDNTSLNIKNQGVGGITTLAGDSSISWQVANIGGRLVVVTGATGVTSLSYDSTTDVVSKISHGILTRDLWGIDDGLATDERPIDLNLDHIYNLSNQGWLKLDPDSPDGESPYLSVFRLFSGLEGNPDPSNADLVHLGKDGADSDKFNSKLITRAFLGTTPAPKGSHVIDLFDRSTTRDFTFGPDGKSLLNNFQLGSSKWDGDIYGDFVALQDVPGFDDLLHFIVTPADKTNSGVSTVAPYAERLFYAGMQSTLVGGDSRSPLLGNLIMFSQLVDAADKIGKCYQDADPASEEISDLLATDGGFIKIPEMSKCLKLIPYSDSLIVFSENGVWEIRGGEEGFKATTFQVIKITDVGAINSNSIVEAEDKIYFWSAAGIYMIFRDQISLGIQITSISETSIQTLFEEFPSSATANTSGIYDPASKQVRWLINSTTSYDGVSERFRYNVEIIYDVLLEAFYISRLPSPDGDSLYLAGFALTPGFLTTEISDNIVIGANQIIVGVGNGVVVSSDIRQGDNSKIKYLAIDPSPTVSYTLGFSFYRNSSFEDWPVAGVGTDANAFLLTGYETGGDTQRQKQVKYITTHFRRTESGFEDIGGGDLEAVNPSGCLIQSQWDFTDSAASNKFGPEFQAYRLKRNFIPGGIGDLFDYGWAVITTKHKLRGRGRALSLLFKTEPQKDLIIYGWGAIFGANTDV